MSTTDTGVITSKELICTAAVTSSFKECFYEYYGVDIATSKKLICTAVVVSSVRGCLYELHCYCNDALLACGHACVYEH